MEENKNMSDLENQIVSVEEMASLMSVTVRQIMCMCRDGRLKSHKFGRKRFFMRKEIEETLCGLPG